MLLITSIVMTSCKCRTWAPLFCRMSNHYSLNAYQLGYNLLVFCFYASAHPVDGAGGIMFSLSVVRLGVSVRVVRICVFRAVL